MKIVYPIPLRFSIEEVKKTEKGSEKGSFSLKKHLFFPKVPLGCRSLKKKKAPTRKGGRFQSDKD